MATHSSIPAWRIPGTEEPGRLLRMRSHIVRHNWSNLVQHKPIFGCGCFPVQSPNVVEHFRGSRRWQDHKESFLRPHLPAPTWADSPGAIVKATTSPPASSFLVFSLTSVQVIQKLLLPFPPIPLIKALAHTASYSATHSFSWFCSGGSWPAFKSCITPRLVSSPPQTSVFPFKMETWLGLPWWSSG